MSTTAHDMTDREAGNLDPRAGSENAEAAPDSSPDAIEGVFETASAAICDAAAAAQRAIERNPALAVAGAAAATAMVVLALRQQRSPEPQARRIEREVRRQARVMSNALREELDARGASSAWADLQRSLSGLDLKPFIEPYLKPLVDQAARVATEAKSQVSSAMK